MSKDDEMTQREYNFVREYSVDWNATRAAIAVGYSARSAYNIAFELLQRPRVIDAVEKIKAEQSAAANLRVQDVVRDIRRVIAADPRDMIDSYQGACRHCWGTGFMYQRTQGEMMRDYNDWEKASKKLTADKKPFDELGGIGFTPKKEPNPDCPECFGDGVQHTRVKDISKMSPDAVALYAGIKQTAHGVEIIMRSKDKAIEQAARYLGMNKETMLIGNVKATDLDDDALAAIATGEAGQ